MNNQEMPLNKCTKFILLSSWFWCNLDFILALFFVIFADFSSSGLRITFLAIFLIYPCFICINFLYTFLCGPCITMKNNRQINIDRESEIQSQRIVALAGREVPETEAKLVIHNTPIVTLFNLEAFQISALSNTKVSKRKRKRSFNLMFYHAILYSLPLLVVIAMENANIENGWGEPFHIVMFISLLLTVGEIFLFVLPMYMCLRYNDQRIDSEGNEALDVDVSLDQIRRQIANKDYYAGPMFSPPTPLDLPILRGCAVQQKACEQSSFEEPPRSPISLLNNNIARTKDLNGLEEQSEEEISVIRFQREEEINDVDHSPIILIR